MKISGSIKVLSGEILAVKQGMDNNENGGGRK